MFTLLAFGLCFVVNVSQTSGQLPDRNGWSSEISTNQPGSIEASRSGANSSVEVGNDIRSQIGLASLEVPLEPAAEPATSPTPPHQQSSSLELQDLFDQQTDQLTSPDGIQSSIKVALLLSVLSLAPAIVLMTTCYIRVVVVLSLLRQAFGGQQLPPTQVITALSLFLTFLIMTPVWTEVKKTAIDPYTDSEQSISWEEAWERGVVPVRNFMIKQIQLADNTESIDVFYRYLPDTAETRPTEISDVPLNVLLPSFMISELKVAFLLGFQVFLPFLVLDLVVSSVTVSMGMLMLPPNMVSFPLKLILFVMVDGWNLVIGMLLQSFSAF